MSRLAVAREPPVGSKFAGYRILGVLGRGSTSIVYRALELRLEREVALKLLSPELSEDRRFRKRFERESKAAASLQHPNIVPVYAAGDVEGTLYIAMRLIEGRDLKALLRKERLRADRALATCAQLASALDAAHASGLVHRDVKPSNVLIEQDAGGDEHVYLADFGLTKTAESGSRATESGQLLGTIDYMAPEQIRGQDVDGRADLYSLGCVFYECLVGEPPFAGRSDVATIYAHLHEPPPAASDRKPALPKAIDAVLPRTLAKQPSERYPTGTELVQEARMALRLPVEASERPWRRRRNWRPALLVTAVVVAAAAIGSALALRSAGGSSGVRAHHWVALPDYRVIASARITNGSPGARPVVGLIAATDNGKDPPARNMSLRPTGELVFRFDAGLLESRVEDSTVAGLLPGTRIGYYINWAGHGGTFVQYPVFVSGTSTDTNTASHVAHAAIRWPRDVWPLIGRVTPITIRQIDSELVATLHLQGNVRKYRTVRRAPLIYSYSGLFLPGLFTNPLEPTHVHASVAARPCVDANCTRLGAAASDAIVYRLPNDLTVSAPEHALYGKRTTFTGTGVPGESVSVVRYEKPGPGGTCSWGKYRFCRPPFGPAFIGDDTVSTRVREDGTWSLGVPMQSKHVDNARSLMGRWAGVASSDDSLRGSELFGSSVFAEASADTVVALARPELTVRRRGSSLAVRIAVDGGDSLVRYTLRFNGKQVDAGRLLVDGTATSLVPAPGRSGRFDVTVSVRGVEPATASAVFRS